MATKVTKPRKKAKILDRTTTLGKERAGVLEESAKLGMKGWLSQAPKKTQQHEDNSEDSDDIELRNQLELGLTGSDTESDDIRGESLKRNIAIAKMPGKQQQKQRRDTQHQKERQIIASGGGIKKKQAEIEGLMKELDMVYERHERRNSVQQADVRELELRHAATDPLDETEHDALQQSLLLAELKHRKDRNQTHVLIEELERKKAAKNDSILETKKLLKQKKNDEAINFVEPDAQTAIWEDMMRSDVLADFSTMPPLETLEEQSQSELSDLESIKPRRKSGTVTQVQSYSDSEYEDVPEIMPGSREEILEVHGAGGLRMEDLAPRRNTPWLSDSSDSSTSSGRLGISRYVPPRLRKGRKSPAFLKPGQRFLEADEIPEEDAVSNYRAPASAPQRRRLTIKQSTHDRNIRRKIMPVLRQSNFSLRKVGASRYLVSAKDVSHGVIEQVKALLKRIPGLRILVDGRIFSKQSGFREIIRSLKENGSVEVSL
jgi:hypothetical protein